MTTELTFLIELLLNHKLPKITRDLVASRIRDVEVPPIPRISAPPGDDRDNWRGIVAPQQAASMQAIMARNPDLVPPPPVVNIAQTPATVAAMNSRQEAINASMNGKVDKASGRPRKF